MKKIHKLKPTFEYEKELWKQGLRYIAGIDEVGRGCFAGPIVAAAVILPQGFNLTNKIDDSKKLHPKVRNELSVIIKKYALCYSIAEVSVGVINTIGIGKAAQRAFRKTIQDLTIKPEHILIDAFLINGISKKKQTPLIYGDSLSISIAAASILAKVYRDKLMEKLHEKYSVYDFFSNKGYGTKKHRDAIGKHGLCDLHRTSFALEKYL